MSAKTAWTGAETTAAVSLAVAISGIGTLWASGVEFPFYPPPGSIIFTTVLIAFVLLRGRFKWAWIVPALMGAVSIAGFIIEGIVGGIGFGNLMGDAGIGAAIGQGLHQLGSIGALIAGVTAGTARRSR